MNCTSHDLLSRPCDGPLFLFGLQTVDRWLRSDQAGISAVIEACIGTKRSAARIWSPAWPAAIGVDVSSCGIRN